MPDEDLFSELFGSSDTEEATPAGTGSTADIIALEQEWLEDIEAFEDKAWSPSAGGLRSGWKALDDGLDGFQTGWIIIAGQSNAGKTSFLSQLAYKLAENNQDKAFVLDISLDDPMIHKLPRTIAAANLVLINAVRNPNAYLQHPNMIQRRTDGIARLKAMKNCYRALDANYIEPTTGKPLADIDAIEALMQRYKIALMEEAKLNGWSEPRKLVVCIDNFYDLQTTAPEAQSSDNARFDYLAVRVDALATKYDACIITTGEFRKLNGFRRPQPDDLRQTIKVLYKCKALLLVHNDVGLRGEAATIYYERQGRTEKQPIFEVKFGKNKFTQFKGTIFFEFIPECAYFNPCGEDDSKRYLSLIYSD